MSALHVTTPAPAVETLPKGTLCKIGGTEFVWLEDAALRDGRWYGRHAVDGIEQAAKGLPADIVYILEKPSPPPPIADGDRLHEFRIGDRVELNGFSLVPGRPRGTIEKFAEPGAFGVLLDDVSLRSGPQFGNAGLWYIGRHSLKLLAQDSPGSAGSVDAAHREKAGEAPPSADRNTPTQPAEPATYTDPEGNVYPLNVYAVTAPKESDAEADARRAKVDRIQRIMNCPHVNRDALGDSCLDCAVSAKEFHELRTHEPHGRSNYGYGGIDKRISEARRSRHKAEVLRDMSRDVRTWRNWRGEVVSFWGKP